MAVGVIADVAMDIAGSQSPCSGESREDTVLKLSLAQATIQTPP